MSAMTPTIPPIAYVVAGLLALTGLALALALVRFSERLSRFTAQLDTSSITIARVAGEHRISITRLTEATARLADRPAPPIAVLDSVELEDGPCAPGGCCRGPLPEVDSTTDLPLVAPTPSVSAREAEAAATRKGVARDRVNAATVTQSAEHH